MKPTLDLGVGYNILVGSVACYEIGPTVCAWLRWGNEIVTYGTGTDVSDDNLCTALRNMLALYRKY